ncbi:Abscisic acid receptor PYL8 [Hibiscus syriacus]|uniref:Abscisic acid receptor PYL8 n=1 Tax=Hibiscus syriacus TaxID=106335 RepID=A0A6A3CDY3_HIBSY|nr:Abscisic acid receptor PYL8 [Hibiscus syriacus]
MNSGGDAFSMEAQYIRRHHRHDIRDHQCSSALVKHIKAPAHLVWSLVRRFDQPQKYSRSSAGNILGIKIVGGDHRLRNYSSIMTVHPEVIEGRLGTMVIESFVVDVPEGKHRG